MAKKYTWTDDTPQGFLNDELEDIDSRLEPYGSDDDAPEDSVYVETSGEVGIGTTSPQMELHVDGRFRVSRSNNPLVDFVNSGANQRWQNIVPSDSSFRVRNVTAGGAIYPIKVFSGAPNDALVITSVGVGIGASSPNTSLDIESTTDPIIELTTTDGSGQRWWLHGRAQGSVGKFGLFDVTDNAYRFVVDTEGFVGIGETSPSGALDVKSTTGGLVVPRMTTTQRDALSPVAGTIIFNTTTSKHEGYDGTSWNAFY